jgi:hypothetical protein
LDTRFAISSSDCATARGGNVRLDHVARRHRHEPLVGAGAGLIPEAGLCTDDRRGRKILPDAYLIRNAAAH